MARSALGRVLIPDSHKANANSHFHVHKSSQCHRTALTNLVMDGSNGVSMNTGKRKIPPGALRRTAVDPQKNCCPYGLSNLNDHSKMNGVA